MHFFSRTLPSGAHEGDSVVGASSAVAIGLAMQVGVLIARLLVKRYEREHGMHNQSYPRAMYLLELLADGVTVLLFAIGTYRAILSSIPV